MYYVFTWCYIVYMAITQYINVFFLHLHIQAYMMCLHPKALKHVEHDIDTTLTHHGHSQEYQWAPSTLLMEHLFVGLAYTTKARILCLGSL